MPGLVVDPTRGQLTSVHESIESMLAAIDARDAKVGSLTRETFGAMVDATQAAIKGPREDAEFQRMSFVSDVYATVTRGEATGRLIYSLRSLPHESFYGAKVGAGATALEQALAAQIDKVALKSYFPNGPLSIPFPFHQGSRVLEACLVGYATDNELSSPRALVGGRRYILTDQALGEILNRAGRFLDAENSSQTKVLNRGFLRTLFNRVPAAVHFDGAKFRLFEAEDFNRNNWVYYHDETIAVGS